MKKQICLVMAAMMAAGMLAGCSGSAKETTAAATEAATTAEETKAEDTTAEETTAASGEETEILVAAAASLKNAYEDKLIRFHKDTVLNKVWVTTWNPRVSVPEGDAIALSVKDNYREAVIEQFPIEAFKPDSSAVLIKVNKVFDGSEKSFNDLYNSISLGASVKKELSRIGGITFLLGTPYKKIVNFLQYSSLLFCYKYFYQETSFLKDEWGQDLSWLYSWYENRLTTYFYLKKLGVAYES